MRAIVHTTGEVRTDTTAHIIHAAGSNIPQIMVCFVYVVHEGRDHYKVPG